MYYETRIHTLREVSTSLEAAQHIKLRTVSSHEALTWVRPDGAKLLILADSVDDPFFEVAVIKEENKRFIQIESITAAWCETPEALAECFDEANENLGFAQVIIDQVTDAATAHFTCGCCGHGFTGNVKYQLAFDQDDGYGICTRCEKSYR
jgi:hypothetical protein